MPDETLIPSALAQPRIKVPEQARAGELIVLKALLRHRMDSGHRIDDHGQAIPRLIINRFIVTFDNALLFSAIIEPSTAENPFFEFTARLMHSGTLRFVWIEDGGATTSIERTIVIT